MILSNIKRRLDELEGKVQVDNQFIELLTPNNTKQIISINNLIEIHMATNGENLETQVNKIKNAKSIIDASPFEICLAKQARQIENYQEYRNERAEFINGMNSETANHEEE